MNNLSNKLEKWENLYDCEYEIPVSSGLLDDLKKELSYLPTDLENFYKITNGLKCDWFEILPIENPERVNKTWDGIKRANNVKTTKFLNADPNLLNQFLIFADIGALKCAAYSKKDSSIWYEDKEQLHQTDLNLEGFIETMLTEVNFL
jgi:hypothetical protein